MKNLYELARELKGTMEDVFNEVEGSQEQLVELFNDNNISDEQANVIFEEFDYYLEGTEAGIRCVNEEIVFFFKNEGYSVEYFDEPCGFSLPSTKGLAYTLSQML